MLEAEYICAACSGALGKSPASEGMCRRGHASGVIWWLAVVGLGQSGSSWPPTEGSALSRRATPSWNVPISLPGSPETHTEWSVRIRGARWWRPRYAVLGTQAVCSKAASGHAGMLQPVVGTPQPGLLGDTCQGIWQGLVLLAHGQRQGAKGSRK